MRRRLRRGIFRHVHDPAAPMPLRLLAAVLALALSAPAAVAQADGPVGASLVGAWDLVAQEGYPEGHPADVQQRLTFRADGTAVMVQRATVGGEAMEHEQAMAYRVEDGALVLVMDDFEMPMEYAVEGDRLVVASADGRRDVYARAE